MKVLAALFNTLTLQVRNHLNKKMDSKYLILIACVCLAYTSCTIDDSGKNSSKYNSSKYIYPDKEGNLVYENINKSGDKILDFSYCGYKGGGVSIPEVPIEFRLKPSGKRGDADAKIIQDAIDKLSNDKLSSDGFRGAILLNKGNWFLNKSIYIKASGIVLRGEKGTILYATAKEQGTLIIVGNGGKSQKVEGTQTAITNPYPVAGSKELNIENTNNFKTGDRVTIRRYANKKWVSAINMDKIAPRIEGTLTKPWKEGWRESYERSITAIKGNTISIDAPIACAFSEEYGGGEIYKCNLPARIYNSGIQDLVLISEWEKDAEGFDSRQHFGNAIEVRNVENGWVTNCKLKDFFWIAVNIKGGHKFTVQNCEAEIPDAHFYEGRGYYAGNGFCIAYGQLVLVANCKTGQLRHPYNFGSGIGGPNAIVYCDGPGGSELHHRFSTGVLWDNCGLLSPVSIGLMDRSWMGSGHGWAAGNSLLWNCAGINLSVESPPVSNNLAIGCKMAYRKPGYSSYASYESINKFVAPQSLYVQQLTERLGSKAVDNAFPKEIQERYSPKYWNAIAKGENMDENIPKFIPYQAYEAKSSNYKKEKLEKLQRKLKREELPANERAKMFMEVGKIYHARKCYERAREAYANATNVNGRSNNTGEMSVFLDRKVLIEMSNKTIYNLAPGENNKIDMKKLFDFLNQRDQADINYMRNNKELAPQQQSQMLLKADSLRLKELYGEASKYYRSLIEMEEVNPMIKSESLLKMTWIHKILGRYNLTCHFYEEILLMDVARPYDRRIALKDLFADFDFDANWVEKYRTSFEF